jgi:hypothetical protein
MTDGPERFREITNDGVIPAPSGGLVRWQFTRKKAATAGLYSPCSGPPTRRTRSRSSPWRVLAAGTPRILGGYMAAASIIPIGDGINVLRSNGPKATAYGVHGATAAVMLAAAAILLTRSAQPGRQA